jgi:hypothetical protein
MTRSSGSCGAIPRGGYRPTTRPIGRRRSGRRCEGLLRAEEGRLAARPPAKSARKRKPARLRLLALPKQPQISKASVMLVRASDGRLRLELESTGSTAITPEVAWRRSIDLDLRRFGLCPPRAHHAERGDADAVGLSERPHWLTCW